jgi:hypothetical protein
MHGLSRSAVHLQLRSLQLQRSQPNPGPKFGLGRLDHSVAVVAAAVLFAFCIATPCAAHQVAESYSSGTWSTATLSVARMRLAATSLPNHRVAFFAGGWGVFCFIVFLAECVALWGMFE